MSFTKFMELALYHPVVGYYRRPRRRIGRSFGTDFYTASTNGAVFGELVAASASHLLRAAGRAPDKHMFVELGAEPGTGGVLAGVSHEFAGIRTVHVGEQPMLANDCVVFSNELFDAQPCVRSVFRAGKWRETGVALRDDALVEVELETLPPYIPAATGESYRFDQPIAASNLARKLAALEWRGLFITFDYGKTLRELTQETPGGTARAYYQHKQSNDLLARPGEQDLTCHICWDWMIDALTANGFALPEVMFQESFLVRHAGAAIEEISRAEAARLSSRKLALMQLLHPAQMGQKFQVLHALR